MKNSTPPLIQSAVDFVEALYSEYERGELDLKTLSISTLVRLQNAINFADSYLQYEKKPGLATFARLIGARVTNL
jgi:hypothetical protein